LNTAKGIIAHLSFDGKGVAIVLLPFLEGMVVGGLGVGPWLGLYAKPFVPARQVLVAET